MREEGHGDKTEIFVSVPYEDGIGFASKEPLDLHFASGVIWISVEKDEPARYDRNMGGIAG